MERPAFGAKTYHIVPKNRTPPNYERVVAALTDDELRADLDAGRGDDGYQAAARAELARRRRRGED